ncbi:P-loop domain-containing protein [Brachybacterium sp. GPGPB12]|uniref:P-loop domain-containing protein n=1 Tax=Brachybacterium sp. GPGPB12 TaxID=3023517 RepID=UPI00313435FB
MALVGDGAILPRRAGDSDLPLTEGAIPFESPASLRVEIDLPSGRRVSGMGIPEGVTVIVGGGFHGKSTPLRALERGIHPHRGGDGREWVITRADAAAIRAEDGRAVTGVDISPFISGAPSGTDTRAFTTANASGSTSQAASLIEAADAGASAR